MCTIRHKITIKLAELSREEIWRGDGIPANIRTNIIIMIIPSTLNTFMQYTEFNCDMLQATAIQIRHFKQYHNRE